MKHSYIHARVTTEQRAAIEKYAYEQERTITSLLLMGLRAYGVPLPQTRKASTKDV